jgi:hypothetical protein
MKQIYLVYERSGGKWYQVVAVSQYTADECVRRKILYAGKGGIVASGTVADGYPYRIGEVWTDQMHKSFLVAPVMQPRPARHVYHVWHRGQRYPVVAYSEKQARYCAAKGEEYQRGKVGVLPEDGEHEYEEGDWHD